MLHDIPRLVVLGGVGSGFLGRRCSGKTDGLCRIFARTCAGISSTEAAGAAGGRAAEAGGRASPPGVLGAEAPAAAVVLGIQVAGAVTRTVAAGPAASPAGSAGVARRAARHRVAVGRAPAAHLRAALQGGAAGLLHVLRLDLPQKAAGLVALGAAVEHPGHAVGDVKLLLGAGDADVGKAALLFQISFGILAHLAGEDTLLHANEEDVGELQAFGGVDGHQHHLIGALVVAVDIADESDIFQIAFQRGVLAVLVAVVFHVVDQLAEVLHPVGGVLVALGHLLLQHRFVAGQLNDVGRELVQRPCLQRFL